MDFEIFVLSQGPSGDKSIPEFLKVGGGGWVAGTGKFLLEFKNIPVPPGYFLRAGAGLPPQSRIQICDKVPRRQGSRISRRGQIIFAGVELGARAIENERLRLEEQQIYQKNLNKSISLRCAKFEPEHLKSSLGVGNGTGLVPRMIREENIQNATYMHYAKFLKSNCDHIILEASNLNLALAVAVEDEVGSVLDEPLSVFHN